MIEYFNAETKKWTVSRFPWLPEDIEELNSFVGWGMYRQIGDAA
ncbi:hypothetical protein [Microbacterium sp. K24]|nr:hypothetical protein [Microbacterium sp. K24]